MHKTSLFLLILSCSLCALGQAQIITTNLDVNKLPKGIKYTGKIKTAIRWTDKAGDNILITTETGILPVKKKSSEDLEEAALYAYHYLIRKNEAGPTWQIYDFIKDCPFDIEASFIKNTLQVTDLNNDGIAEIWLMYKTVCRSDVSPHDMKIIMYQGQKKYAMRGQSKVRVSEKEFYGGGYKFDNSFNTGPAAFKDFAKRLWDKNVLQR